MLDFTKVVTAEVAAEAMGGFSYPKLADDEIMRASKSIDATMTYLNDGKCQNLLNLDKVMLETYTDILIDYRDQARTRREAESQGVRFWYHDGSVGGRLISFDPGTGYHAVADEPWGTWIGYDPQGIISAEYNSATSGSGMRYTRTVFGRGTLEFLPSQNDPSYRGSYFKAWNEAEEAPALAFSSSSAGYR
ncbi:MAG: hypothetical protein ABI303_00430 [Candidatus Saccharimonas sp.]